MSDIPFFSIIINCHNGEDFLQQTFDSIWSQSFRDYEVIFWDNNSNDCSYQIASSQNMSNIKCYRNSKYTSLGTARNLAVKKARGIWICFLDADDIWKSDKLKLQACAIAKNPDCGLFYSNYDTIDANNNIIKSSCLKKSELKSGEVFDKLIKFNFIGILTAAIRKTNFTGEGGFHSSLSIREDHHLFLKLSKETKVYAIQNNECQYRIHSSNYSKDRIKSYKEAIFVYRDFDQICQIRASYLRFKLYFYELRHRHFSATIEIIKKHNSGKAIYIWGTGSFGNETFKMLTGLGIKINGFYDNHFENKNSKFHGLDVLPPLTINDNHNIFIVIASCYHPEIQNQLTAIGLYNKKDFCNIDYLDINQVPPEKHFFYDIYNQKGKV